MIKLNSDLDYLKRLIADLPEGGRGPMGNDLIEAAQDIEALVSYVERLKHHTDHLNSEIDRLRKQREATAAALVEILQPALDDMISSAIDDSTAFDDLEDRVRRLEDDDDQDDEQVRAAVRAMISDGEIVVSIDHV